MVLALLLTAASIVIGAVGVLLADCASAALNVFGTDPVQLCAGVARLGVEPAPWMGWGLVAISILGLITAWVPTKSRRARRADMRSISALQDNLSRVRQISPKTRPSPEAAPARDGGRSTEPASVEEIEMAPKPDPGPLDALHKLVDDLREGFENVNSPRQDLMETWIATMRICNELHNAGELDTADFKKLNSGLLELVSPDLIASTPAPN